MGVPNAGALMCAGRMHKGIAALEDSSAISYKIKHRLVIWPSIALLDI